MNAIIPIPRCEVSIRPATLADIPFMDALQKKYGKALGYFPTKQFEGYVETGGVLIAEERANSCQLSVASEAQKAVAPAALDDHRQRTTDNSSFLGYIISRDRYLKRDELGVVYQLCVSPGVQRKLVGAALVREAFERSAYGCRLYCCWCAQDLDANYFWESLGFVPIAFRAGSLRRGSGRAGTKTRVHIFWQKRIGAGDEATPWWYPFQTNSGAIRQDRVVFPIPPGVHWKDVQAVVAPENQALPGAGDRLPEAGERLPVADDRLPVKKVQRPARGRGVAKRESNLQSMQGPPAGKVAILVGGRIKYVNRPGYVAPGATSETAMMLPALPAPGALSALPAPGALSALPAHPAPAALKARKRKAPAAKTCLERSRRIDPNYLAAARELRDRWLEKVNTGQYVFEGPCRYEVARALPSEQKQTIRMLPAAA